jgi:hypothetical protein
VLEDKKRKESLERKASVKNIKTENKKETKKNA